MKTFVIISTALLACTFVNCASLVKDEAELSRPARSALDIDVSTCIYIYYFLTALIFLYSFEINFSFKRTNYSGVFI